MKQYASEGQEAKALWDWANIQKFIHQGKQYRISDHLFHIPNEGKRSPQTGKYLKDRGLVPGAHDYAFTVPIDPYHGLFFDLKKIGGKARKNQQDFADIRRAMGYYCDEQIEGFEAAVKLLTDYLNGKL